MANLKKRSVRNGLLQSALKGFGAEIADTIKKQLQASVDGNDKPLYNSKVNSYVYAPSRKKPPGPNKPYVLKDTGKLYRAIEVSVEPNGIEIRNGRDKLNYIEKNFGNAIIKLSPTGFNRLIETAKPFINDEFKNYIKYNDEGQ